MRAFTARLALRIAWCLAMTVVLAPNASAEELNTTVERPIMYFGFDPDPGRQTICGNGFLREPPSPAPQWTIDAQGTRSDGTTITGHDATGTQSAFLCIEVDKRGALSGTYMVIFRYHALPTDPVSQIVAHVTWYPGNEGGIVATDQ